MLTYTTIDKNGEVSQVLTAFDLKAIQANVQPGETLVPGIAPGPGPYYWANGAWVARPAAPSPFALWDPVARQWTDARTVDDMRAAKWAEIKAARTAATLKPVLTTPWGNIDADGEAVNNIERTLAGWGAAVGLGVQIPSVDWTMADNTVVPLTFAQLSQVSVLMLQRGQQAFATGRTLRRALDAATTPADIAAVTWPT